MPPKFKFTKDEIIESAFTIVRCKGWNALSTRSLAAELGTSSRPIYSFFNSAKELEEEIVKKAVDLLHAYMTRETTGNPWHDHGIGYVLFAMEERFLFRSITDEAHITLFKEYGDAIWDTLTESLSTYPPFQGLTSDQIYQIQMQRWLFAHGLAFSASNPPPETWTSDNIIAVMQSGSQAIYIGLLEQFRSSAETPSTERGRHAKKRSE